MTMTIERTQALADYLMTDKEKTQRIVELSPEEAVKAINADGYDYTVEEIEEFGLGLRAAYEEQKDEFSDSELESVSGGVVLSTVAIYAACAAGGVGLGVCVTKGWW